MIIKEIVTYLKHPKTKFEVVSVNDQVIVLKDSFGFVHELGVDYYQIQHTFFNHEK